MSRKAKSLTLCSGLPRRLVKLIHLKLAKAWRPNTRMLFSLNSSSSRLSLDLEKVSSTWRRCRRWRRRRRKRRK